MAGASVIFARRRAFAPGLWRCFGSLYHIFLYNQPKICPAFWHFAQIPPRGIEKIMGFVFKSPIDFLAGNAYNIIDTLCLA